MARLAPVVAVLLAATAQLARGAPPTPPPNQDGGPPPAWLEKPGTDRWLAYSSYCWTTKCADFIPPQLRTDLPKLRFASGTLVRFHLGFRPTSTLRLGLVGGRTWTLAATRVSSWKAGGRGVYLLEARAAAGDASYAFRIL